MTDATPVRRLSLILLAAALLLPACSKKRSAESDDAPPADAPREPTPAPRPKATVTPSQPKSPTTPTSPPSPWAGTAIPFDYRRPVTFGPPGCPVLVVGTTVHDARTYKPVRQLTEAYEPQALRVLSADGSCFAAGSKSPNQQETGVTVWSTETGQRLLDVPPVKEAFVDVMVFHGNTHLLVGGRHDRAIHVWDIRNQKIVGQLTVPDMRVDADKLAFSPDGKSFAGPVHDKLVISEVATNRVAATATPPAEVIGRPDLAKPTDPIFVYAWTRGLAFSPDSSELALFSTHPDPRLLVWTVNGKLVLDLAVPRPRYIGHQNTLEWLPDGSGWLVNGNLVDRASRRVVVSIRVPFATDVLPHVLDKNRVIGVFGEERERLQTITVPWEKIHASLKLMNQKGAAYLSPGEAVTLQLDLTALRGDEAETRKILTDALTRRLARDGIGVAAGRPTILRLRLSEQAGETLPVYERQSPFDRRGADTGRRATEAKGAAVLELWAQGEPRPLWRGNLTASSSRSFREEITDETMRKSMLEHLSGQLSGMDMPYFIPKAKDVVALPAVVE